MTKSINRAIFSLTFLKLIDFLFPLILIPMAINTIGIDNYGVVVFFQSIVLLFIAIIDFGFSLTGIQKLSTLNCKKRESRYLLASIIIKSFLFILSAFVFYILIYFNSFYRYEDLVLVFLVIMLSSVFNFQWYFQSKNKYRFILLTSFFSRALAFIIFFLIVKEKNDLLEFTYILLIMYLIPSLVHSCKLTLGLHKAKLNYRYLKVVFNSNWNVFVYRIVNAAVLPSYVYMLGFIFTPSQLGAFGVVQRIFGAFLNFSTPIMQAMLPGLSNLKMSNYQNYNVTFKKYLKITSLFSFLVMFLLPILVYLLINFNIIKGGISFSDTLYPMVIFLSFPFHVLNSYISQNIVLIGRGRDVRNIIIGLVLVSLLTSFMLFHSGYDLILYVYSLTYFVIFTFFYYKNKRLMND